MTLTSKSHHRWREGINQDMGLAALATQTPRKETHKGSAHSTN